LEVEDRHALQRHRMVGLGSHPAIPFGDIPDIHGNGAPSRSKDDLSYRRPLTNRRALRIPAD
jgi:hypothetical protein